MHLLIRFFTIIGFVSVIIVLGGLLYLSIVFTIEPPRETPPVIAERYLYDRINDDESPFTNKVAYIWRDDYRKRPREGLVTSYVCMDLPTFTPANDAVWIAGPETGENAKVRNFDVRQWDEPSCLPEGTTNNRETIARTSVTLSQRRIRSGEVILYHAPSGRFFHKRWRFEYPLSPGGIDAKKDKPALNEEHQ